MLDVGCHPGGWAQVAVELVGEEGRVVGVDLQPCAPVEGAVLLTGDITDPVTQERILNELDGALLNVIVSDISPDITGKWDMDQSVAMTLVADVFDFALPLLTKEGGFTTKLFQGIGVEELITAVRPHFSSVRRFSPDASRNSSSEVYLVCKHHTPWKAPKASVRERYEAGVNKLVGGDEIEADPLNRWRPRSVFGRKKPAATLKRVEANSPGHEHPARTSMADASQSHRKPSSKHTCQALGTGRVAHVPSTDDCLILLHRARGRCVRSRRNRAGWPGVLG